ncbi:MAG: hypothetical protein Q9219_002452 [cf. Caloplaca sp. 3 TL-2023]
MAHDAAATQSSFLQAQDPLNQKFLCEFSRDNAAATSIEPAAARSLFRGDPVGQTCFVRDQLFMDGKMYDESSTHVEERFKARRTTRHLGVASGSSMGNINSQAPVVTGETKKKEQAKADKIERGRVRKPNATRKAKQAANMEALESAIGNLELCDLKSCSRNGDSFRPRRRRMAHSKKQDLHKRAILASVRRRDDFYRPPPPPGTSERALRSRNLPPDSFLELPPLARYDPNRRGRKAKTRKRNRADCCRAAVAVAPPTSDTRDLETGAEPMES